MWRGGVLLIACVVVQLLSGFVALYAVGFEKSAEAPTAFEICVTTWHQANGALVLALSVFLAAWLRRPSTGRGSRALRD